ncbi:MULTISPECIES: ABC transporter ATP-binding protein [unclassified Herbaspirillum]|uniref:ABC transporter ATP-binding protein n=1 Tax=unclassified Herbaspirillum TaxID=2624150 RepID=UPI00114F0ED6|nr:MULTISPECIES: ABC transporter ATP-binding protein [unclassified Herbaspirillum]MBB5393559.1 branched-chain amino acid transport system ATP-binding protein [Herbaspirillum sp. SJZ102]TQK03693.1 amino acid/amide ABC transporter ATP-binding protein 2 (HAAT family) [Herbaspirillum sp. SJZ130]TQK08425.1 amino acid/amide ABC transporter ATP-binding protein 2 (HAAT family) [Herbaspirillum sp. SJZ106]TWC71688.1 amino acid/amide ABC transporter ATP-binding protein 2 (HAAT family) [Herbaspirillum sp. 
MTGNSKPILQIEDLAVAYGHIEAVKGISLTLNEGEITALVGANGAGKSTSLLAISGLVKAQRGRVLYRGEKNEGDDLVQMSPHRIVEAGVVQVAEGRATLTTLTVEENLALGAYTRKDKDGVARDLDWVYSLFPVLKNRAAGLAGNLSGGEQQMLAIGRALMARPKVLLLDEPSMGLAPLIIQEIFRIVQEINKTGMTVLLVEQNVRQALRIAQRGYVLETGKIVLEDTGANLLGNPKVVEAYLGG